MYVIGHVNSTIANSGKRNVVGQFTKAQKVYFTILFRQVNDDTKSNIKLSTEGVKQEMCFGSNNGGLTYPPINAITIIKGLHNYSNRDASDKHPFKEDMKTKFAAAKAVAGNFPNGKSIYGIYDEANTNYGSDPT